MMVTYLLEPKADIEIRTGEACLLSGATIPVEVAVSPQEQLNPREVRLELVGTEIYYVTGQSGRIGKRANEFIRVSSTLKDQPSFPPGVMTSRKFSIQIPVDAPPSCRGRELLMDWTLKAVINLPKRINLVHESSVQVMSTPASAGKAITDSPGKQNHKDCNLILEVPVTAVSKGAVSGNIQVEALKEFQVRGLRVELRKIEDVAGIEKTTDTVAQQDLSGPVSFNTGEAPSFSFSLPLPPDAPPTVVTPHSSLRWQVRAIIDRRMRRDINIERDVLIYNADDPAE